MSDKTVELKPLVGVGRVQVYSYENGEEVKEKTVLKEIEYEQDKKLQDVIESLTKELADLKELFNLYKVESEQIIAKLREDLELHRLGIIEVNETIESEGEVL